VFNVVRLSLVILVLLGVLLSRPAFAGTQTNAVDCSIDNLTPQIPVGAQASYVVNLSGGLGNYSVTLAYGDGQSDSRSVSASQTSFSHVFLATGAYGQTAYVSGAGSSATCATSTSVY
jgi:hypothetical protein